LIAGCERTLWDKSHLIGLFLQRNLRSQSVRELIPEIREQGGLVYLPHPFRAYSGLLGADSKHSEADRQWALEQGDIIEIFNRKCTAEENRLALELLDRYPKAFAAGSDAHFAHEIGFACTEYSFPLSPENFHAAASYAPPADQAAQLAAFRDDRISPARAMARDTLQALGLLASARTARNYLNRLRQPRLQKYR